MRAGDYRKRVTIYSLVSGSPQKNDLGEPNVDWEELDTVWAAIEPITGREFWAQQQVQSEITVKIRIRYRDDVVSGMKVTYLSKTYFIKNVIDWQEEHRELQLMCSEGVINV